MIMKNINYIQSKKGIFKNFSQELLNNCITKKQFENYLLFLISEKAAEISLIQNYKFTNYSNLGNYDLQKISQYIQINIL